MRFLPVSENECERIAFILKLQPMFIVNSYALAVLFCFITMMCWGSWGNTQKLASARAGATNFSIGTTSSAWCSLPLVVGFTMGSIGSEGRSFLRRSGAGRMRAAWGASVLGGVIFNASNILLSASVAMAGLSVAFPLGVGLALVLGVVVNYVGAPKGDPVILFLGVALIVVGDRLQRHRLAARVQERRYAACAVPQGRRAGGRGRRADVALLPLRRGCDGSGSISRIRRRAC